MGIDQDKIVQMVTHVLREYSHGKAEHDIPVEISGRHVHLSSQHIEALFGKGYELTKKKDLSQPEQFVSNERVTIFTSKGQLKNVAVLGPARNNTQVEMSLTDANKLGLRPPINLSGNLNGAVDVYIMWDQRVIKAENSVIVAANHIHMTNEDAKRWGLKDQQHVRVKMETKRPIVFENVQVRAGDSHRLAMHIDTDEANACAYENGDIAKILAFNGPKEPSGKTKAEDKTNFAPTEEKLITAERAGELRKAMKSKIRVAKGTIITPLAKDVLKEAKIEVEYVQEENGVNL